MSGALNRRVRHSDYEAISISLSLDRLRDLYAPYYTDLILRDYAKVVSPDQLREFFKYDEWVIVGPLITQRDIRRINEGRGALGVAVADSALSKAVHYGIEEIDVFVTDFDGLTPFYPAIHMASEKSELISAHLHGDNIHVAWRGLIAFKSYGKRILPTIQAGNAKRAFNIGGFTDGDRAVMIAYLSGAKRVYLAGIDFSLQPVPNSFDRPIDIVSRYKLHIANKIIRGLAEEKILEIERWR